MKYISTLLFGIGLCSAASAQFQVSPIFATSPRPAQPGTELSKCFDGDVSTIYHSSWSINAIPDTVDFFFNGVSNVNKIEYFPRPSGLNGVWQKVELYSRKANTAFVKAADLTWANDNTMKVINLPGNGLDTPAYVRFVVTQATGNFSSCAEMKFWSSAAQVVPIDCTNPGDGLTGLLDTKVAVQNASVSPAANSAGEGIDKTIDNNKSTFYHSSWAGGGFPIEMTYNFQGNNQINYIVYTPRQDGSGNGHFGNVEIWYKTTPNGTPIKAKDASLNFSGTPSRIELASPLVNVRAVIVKVLSGQSNFASCAEMEFFKKNPASGSVYNNMFDSLYSVLKPGVTQAQIDTVSMPFFKTLAQCLYNHTYQRKFRYQSYKVYPQVGTTAASLKTSTYNSFENPTGIAFKANTKAVLFVGATNGVTPSLRVTDFGSASITDRSYVLSEGLNVIDITADGLGYINYYNNDSTKPDIKIHIATGRVNGYYDPKTDTDTDWFGYLTNQIYPTLDIKGRFVNLNYHKAALLGNSPQSGHALIGVYDSIVNTEYILMGLYKYNRVPKNHMFAWSAYSGGWYAGGWGAHFDLTWGEPGLANAEGVKVSPWGIAHEFGHVNQVRPGFVWTGTTEVTNNLYSVWVDYTMGTSYPGRSRLDDEPVSPDDVRPDIAGGRINGAILHSLVKKRAIMSNPDVFKRLVLFWQLELYYQSAGASKNLPTLQQRLTGTPAPGGNQPDVAFWLGDMLEKVRTTNDAGLTNKDFILNCVKNVCDVVKEDLSDFFVKSGLLAPIDEIVDDYSPGRITITQQDVTNTINAIKAKNYPAPVSPVIHYLSANSVNTFKNLQTVSGTSGVGATLSNNTITVDASQWQHAVAFETYKNDTLVDVAIFGTGSGDNSFTKVLFPDTATAVFAIGYNGEKKLVYPATLPNQVVTGIPEANGEHANIKVYPNPTSSFVNVTLNGEGKRALDLRMTDITGTLMHARRAFGGETVQVDMSRMPPGMYFLQVLSKHGVITKKVIKQ
ncbi:M60 family metallopeptidase [Chitinophaga caseinilytica]|uniref:M60 family metallopeptidase n=1 Tax=Chitinophaga caseinilytica TaxID=2267521 RepID=UPI003C2BBBAA